MFVELHVIDAGDTMIAIRFAKRTAVVDDILDIVGAEAEIVLVVFLDNGRRPHGAPGP